MIKAQCEHFEVIIFIGEINVIMDAAKKKKKKNQCKTQIATMM